MISTILCIYTYFDIPLFDVDRNHTGFSINPCNVKFTNAHMFNPASSSSSVGRCVKFTAATEGDLFVVFASIPNDHRTWYHIQITKHGVAVYKVQKSAQTNFKIFYFS